MVHVQLFPAQNNITVPTLIDSGCSGHASNDRSFTLTHGISTFPLPHPREIRLVNGAVSDIITQFAVIPISMSGHKENSLLLHKQHQLYLEYHDYNDTTPPSIGKTCPLPLTGMGARTTVDKRE
jgi:hypothetical protein